MATAGPGPAISLADVRLIRRLRSGEPAARAELWAQWKGPIWSVCRAMVSDRAEGVQLLARIYGSLSTAVRGWREDRPVCCALAAWLLTSLKTDLQLAEPEGIHRPLPETVCRSGPANVQRRLASLSPEIRLVYLVDLMFCCPAGWTAELSGLSEGQIRAARSNAAWTLVEAERT